MTAAEERELQRLMEKTRTKSQTAEDIKRINYLLSKKWDLQ